MLNKNIQKMNKRKNKRVKDKKKAAERERTLPRNRQVQNYYMKKLLGILVLGLNDQGNSIKRQRTMGKTL